VRRTKKKAGAYSLVRILGWIESLHGRITARRSTTVKFPVHTRDTVPQNARDTLIEIVEAWGFLPNLGAVMAESPAALELLWVGYAALSTKGTLTPAEQQLVCIAASRENACAYCVAAHSTMAVGAKLDHDALSAAREGRTSADRKLDALRSTTERLVRQRGWLADAEKRAFVDAGYTPGQLLEVVGWISLKILTNYTNHIAETPVDPQWRGQTWVPPLR
jgi:AhpD family alkylhydroperoxidase